MPCPVPGEFFQAVAGWAAQVADFGGGVDHQEFAFGLAGERAVLSGGLPGLVEGLGVFVGEGFEHDGTWYVSWIGVDFKAWWVGWVISPILVGAVG